MRITFLNQKGGVGKSTLVLLIAAMLNEATFDVAIDDRDEQGSARFFAGKLGLPLLESHTSAAYIVTDTPGRLQLDALRELVATSDRLVLVTEKSSTALHGTYAMAELIVKHKRPDAKAYVLFNKVRAGTKAGETPGEEIAKTLDLPPLSIELPLATAFDNACRDGLGVVAGKRREELMKLAMEILK